MAAKKDSQTQLFDRTIESAELEAALELIMEWKDRWELKELAAARKTIKEVTEQHKLADGERLRIGQFVITGKARAGGGFEVPEWHKVTVGTIADISASE